MTISVVVGYLHPGHISAAFHTSLLNLIAHDLGSRGVVARGGHIASWCVSGRIAESRNDVTASFLDGPSDWLWFVDSDMGFEPDTVDRLLRATDRTSRPVVGALCFGQAPSGGPSHAPTFEPFPTLYEWYEDDQRAGFVAMRDYPKSQTVKVAGTGAASLMIHRSALLKIRDKYGPCWFSHIAHPQAGVLSEDLSFCMRLAAVDLPVYVDTSVAMSHEKNVFLTEEHYEASRERAAGKVVV